MSNFPTQIEVFCSYAHEDERLCNALEKHLSLLSRQGLVTLWHDRLILPGIDWAQTIDAQLETASIILLLVSAHFFASDYCSGVEMRRALQRHEANEACVLPILLRPVDWKWAPFAHLQVLPTNAKPITMWVNRDAALRDVVTGIRRVIEDIPLRFACAPRATLPVIWTIPFSRNSFFLGRDDFLANIRTHFQAGQITALSQPQAISGLGGIGKTQLAVEYAYRYHQEYEVVLWARAESQEALISSYSAIATLLYLPERTAQEQEITVQAVKHWLQTHRKWLLILDNADDLDLLPAFLPLAPGGDILITTRAWEMQRLAHRITVVPLPVDQGALFLLRRAGLLAPNAHMEKASFEERALAIQLTEQMGGLPLALDQAGAYLEATGTSLVQYQQIYQRHRRDLHQQRRARVADHPEPVATTWSLSFQQVEQRHPAAADLLRLCAFLAPDGIPEELLTNGAAHLGPVLEPMVADPFLLSEAVEALRTYSLLSRNPRTHLLIVHRLVQAVLCDEMEGAVAQRFVERAIRIVVTALPEVEYVHWPIWERFIGQAQACAERVMQDNLHFAEAARVLQLTGKYVAERARYSEAEPLLERALLISEREKGKQHLDTASSLHDLAYLYERQGKYAQAELLYQRALTIYEQQLGSEHPNTAISLNGLAILYRRQGKYAQAEPMFQRALTIREQHLGPEHPDTAQSLNSLAYHFRKQGKYAQAEPMYQRALTIYEQHLGPEHPDTATSLDGLALIYEKQGKYAQAEPLFQRALTIREQQYGPNHHYTAASIEGLAQLYEKQDKYAEAEPLYQRALIIYEQHLGSEHPYTARSLNGLAQLYNKQGKYAEAEPLYQRALAINEQHLGPEHPETAISLNGLAELYRNQGKYAEAEPLYQRALAIRKQQLGWQHPDTLRVQKQYTVLLDLVECNAEDNDI